MRRIGLSRGSKIVIIVAITALGTVTGIGAFASYQSLHPGRKPISKNPGDYELPYEDITLTTSDGLRLKGWFIPSKKTNATIIALHGYQSSRQEMLPVAKFLFEHGYNVLVFDFRAHGESEGSIVSFGYHEVKDVQAAVDYVKNRKGLDPKRIGLIGFSMGAATAIMFAGQSGEVRAVVEDSGYTSLESAVSQAFTKYTRLPTIPFSYIVLFFGQIQLGTDISNIAPIRYISKISPRPIMILHGERDSTVNVADGRALANAAKEPRIMIFFPDAEHVEAVNKYQNKYVESVTKFFDDALHR